MTRTLKKRMLTWLMALTVLMSSFAEMKIIGVRVSAITVSEITIKLKTIADRDNNTWYMKDGCFAYARKVFKEVFGIEAPSVIESFSQDRSHQLVNNGNVNWIADCSSVTTEMIAKDAFLLAKPGDIVQCLLPVSRGGHTMIVYSVSETYVTILDCNVYEDGKVYLRNESYSDFAKHYAKFTIYRAVNYPVEEPAPTISAPTTKAELESRINSIINGQYGNGKTFPYSSTPVPISLAGEAGGTGTFGYARYVFYQVFGISMSPGVAQNEWQLSNGNGNLETVASCGGTSDASTMKADIFKTKPGDVIQGKGSGFYQTMIVLSYDENSITILDCDNDYKCGIAVRTRDWAKFSSAFKQYTIYRSKNYPVSESLKQITVNITKPAGTGSLDTTIKYVEVCGSGIHTLLSISDNGTMALTGIPDGKYTFTFSANNCAPNRYGVDIKNGTVKGLENGVELHLIGDIDGNGKVNTLDVAKANAHAKNRILLSGYDLTVSDIDSNGKVNTLDVAKINAHAKNKIGLW